MPKAFIDVSDLIAQQGAIKKMIEDKQVEVAAKITVDLHADLVRGSPVDSGEFRGAWTVDTPAKPFQNGKIENQTVYGPALMRGHSSQAPDGWVENAIEARTRL